MVKLIQLLVFSSSSLHLFLRSGLERIIVRKTASNLHLHLHIPLITSASSLTLFFLSSSRLSLSLLPSRCYWTTSLSSSPFLPFLPSFPFSHLFLFSRFSHQLSYIYFFLPRCLMNFSLRSFFSPSPSRYSSAVQTIEYK